MNDKQKELLEFCIKILAKAEASGKDQFRALRSLELIKQIEGMR